MKAAERGRIFESWHLQLDFFSLRRSRCRHRPLLLPPFNRHLLLFSVPLGLLLRFIIS
jgi:hypothetical protein